MTGGFMRLFTKSSFALAVLIALSSKVHAQFYRTYSTFDGGGLTPFAASPFVTTNAFSPFVASPFASTYSTTLGATPVYTSSTGVGPFGTRVRSGGVLAARSHHRLRQSLLMQPIVLN